MKEIAGIYIHTGADPTCYDNRALSIRDTCTCALHTLRGVVQVPVPEKLCSDQSSMLEWLV